MGWGTFTNREIIETAASFTWVAIVHVLVYAINENGGLKRFCAKRPRTTFFTSNRRPQYDVLDRPRTYWAADVHDPRHPVQCWFLPGKLGTFFLLCWRLFIVAYAVATIVIVRYLGEGLQDDFMTAFTHWSVALVGLYGLISALNTLRHLVHSGKRQRATTELTNRDDSASQVHNEIAPSTAPDGFPASKTVTVPLAPSYDFLDRLSAILLITVASSAIFLTALYWGAIAPDDTTTNGNRADLDNLMRHGANIVVTLLDVFFSRTPVCGYWYHAPLIYGTIYAIFFAVYSSVATSPYPGVTGNGIFYYALLLPFALLIAFLITYLVALIREALYRGCCCCTRARHDEKAVYDKRRHTTMELGPVEAAAGGVAATGAYYAADPHADRHANTRTNPPPSSIYMEQPREVEYVEEPRHHESRHQEHNETRRTDTYAAAAAAPARSIYLQDEPPLHDAPVVDTSTYDSGTYATPMAADSSQALAPHKSTVYHAAPAAAAAAAVGAGSAYRRPYSDQTAIELPVQPVPANGSPALSNRRYESADTAANPIVDPSRDTYGAQGADDALRPSEYVDYPDEAASFGMSSAIGYDGALPSRSTTPMNGDYVSPDAPNFPRVDVPPHRGSVPLK